MAEADKNYFYRVSGAYLPTEIYKKVRPEESHELLMNPHKGFVTFQHFNGDPLFDDVYWSEEGPLEFEFVKKTPDVVEGFLPTTVAYCRWFWRNFEPQPGKFNWSMVENALKAAKIRGQTLMVRLQPFGSKKQPQLPEWFMKIAPVKQNPAGYFDPDYDSEEYFKYWTRLNRDFARRFGDHPDLETVDIAFIGPWGEGAGDISKKSTERFIDFYVKNFKRSMLVANCGYQLIYGTGKGTGWRADSYGDVFNDGRGMVPDGLGWNHMFDSLPRENFNANKSESWKRAPVVFESCPLYWHKWGLQLDMLDFVIEQGLKFHCSTISTLGTRIPDEYRERFIEFIKRMGYRFVLRQMRYDRKLKGKKKMNFEMWIENIGVAPVYKDYYALALRFSQGDKTHVYYSKEDIRKWLPGDIWISETVNLPQMFSEGEIMIDAAIVRKKTGEPAIKFAIKGMKDDGWYPMDTVEAG